MKKIPQNTLFTIHLGTKEILLNESTINQYVFETPGKYTIDVTTPKQDHLEACSGHKFPQKIFVTVYSVKCTFRSEELVFSKPIKKGIELQGEILSIPIDVKTYRNQEVSSDIGTVSTAGIGITIKATPSENQKVFHTGTYTITYQLQGNAAQQGVIVFDFIDLNHKVQSIPIKIEN
ncbi:hypothetical protein [Flavobacterium aciduliphilum]|uniref:hypothetical protein n=1 Tax=Flavobacterium aciduliphilum TaxID=1101402 RepID=UPI000DD49DE9|nr:hypothetical protein [Flavobacterium aciduliphilum]